MQNLTKMFTNTSNEPDSICWMMPLALPARCNAKQAAALLGVKESDIPTLIEAKLLTPLAKPVQNSTKYFATCAMVRLTQDEVFLNKATQTLYKHWSVKNSRRRISGGVLQNRIAAKPNYRPHEEPVIDIESAVVTRDMAAMAEPQ